MAKYMRTVRVVYKLQQILVRSLIDNRVPCSPVVYPLGLTRRHGPLGHDAGLGPPHLDHGHAGQGRVRVVLGRLVHRVVGLFGGW